MSTLARNVKNLTPEAPLNLSFMEGAREHILSMRQPEPRLLFLSKKVKSFQAFGRAVYNLNLTDQGIGNYSVR